MKRKLRISLLMKKPGKVDKLRAAVEVCDRVFSTNSVGHVRVSSTAEYAPALSLS
jgi:hypothetical protein